jgi:hypothetical protein
MNHSFQEQHSPQRFSNATLSRPNYLIGSAVLLFICLVGMMSSSWKHWSIGLFISLPFICILPWLALWRQRSMKAGSLPNDGPAGHRLICAALIVPLIGLVVGLVVLLAGPASQQLGHLILGIVLGYGFHVLGLKLLAVALAVPIWRNYWHKWLTIMAIVYHWLAFMLFVAVSTR